MVKIAALLLALLLAGCAKDWGPASREAGAIRDACDAQRANGELTSYVAAERCAGPRISAIYRTAQFPHADLIDHALAQRLVVAEQRDNGELTDIQAAAQFSTIRTQTNAAIRNRMESAEANAISRAALINSMFPAPPAPMTCTTVAGITNCY